MDNNYYIIYTTSNFLEIRSDKYVVQLFYNLILFYNSYTNAVIIIITIKKNTYNELIENNLLQICLPSNLKISTSEIIE